MLRADRSRRSRVLPLVMVLTAGIDVGCNRGEFVAGPSVAPALQCSGYGPQAASPYVLPYPAGRSYLVLQGNCSGATHNSGEVFKYAYDFAMDIGTPVHAARRGVVLAAEDRHPDGTRTLGDENFVFVRHDDGTIGRYVHLTKNGALVEAGQTVTAGDLIGLSGDSGWSTAPHLHFDVTLCPEWTCVSVPVVYRNTRAHPNGLVEGEEYVAN